MLIHRLERYSPETLSYEPFSGQPLANGFVLRLRLAEGPVPPEERELCVLPGTLRILTRHAEPVKPGCYEYGECYRCWPMEDGTFPVIEAEVQFTSSFRPNWKTIRMGLPLSLYDPRKQDLYLVWTGVQLRWICGGLVVNEDMPVGAPAAPEGPLTADLSRLAALDYSPDAASLSFTETTEASDVSINYYSPPGHNMWAGDAVNYWKDGVYHLLFLQDRHHHQNRWGGGAHFFRHLITRDFVTWEDLGPLFRLEEQWQSVGTGTMFSWQDKLWFSFGWHSDRVVPREHLYSDRMLEAFPGTGEVRSVTYEELSAMDCFPNGGNLAVSDDGVRFRMAETMYHWVENPSVYEKPDGTLAMYGGFALDEAGGGTAWEAERPEGPWRMMQGGFTPDGRTSPMRHTNECPSFFEKNGFRYVIMGVTGYWRTEKDSDVYMEDALNGHDLYDGLLVPMALCTDTGRLIYTGWLGGIGWGSVLAHRELIQYPDGHLGMKWLPELAPKAQGLLWEARAPQADLSIPLAPKASDWYEMTVTPGPEGGKAAVRFLSDDPEAPSCEILVDFTAGTAQFGTPAAEGFAPHIRPAGEAIPAEEQGDRLGWSLAPEDLHFRSADFAIGSVECLNGAFPMKIVRRYSRKMDSTILDVELGGVRTMISNRVGLRAEKLQVVCDGAEVTNLRAYPYEEEPMPIF